MTSVTKVDRIIGKHAISYNQFLSWNKINAVSTMFGNNCFDIYQITTTFASFRKR